MRLFQLLLRLFLNYMLIGYNALFFGDISAFQTKNCRKPVDTPLRETVPRSALTMGVDDLFRAVFFIHASSARFIGKYGCEAYFRYNRELMFYERNRELNREISALKLDLTDADAEGHCGHCIQNHEEGRRDRK